MRSPPSRPQESAFTDHCAVLVAATVAVESCSSLTALLTLQQQTAGRAPQPHQGPSGTNLTCGPTASGSSGELNDLLLPVFRSDRDVFAGLSVFQFDPHTFQITHRVTAERAHWSESMSRWLYEQGWERTLSGSTIQNYHKYDRRELFRYLRKLLPTSRKKSSSRRR